MKENTNQRNDPNKNYAMYLQDRIAKEQAQPKFSSDKGEQCIYCGKNSWECEDYEEANQE